MLQLSYLNKVMSITSKTVDIYHYSDVHGFHQPYPFTGNGPIGGAAGRRATLREWGRKPEDPLVGLGDGFYGSIAVNESRGESAILEGNQLGYLFELLGNHDFRHGLEGLRRLRSLSDHDFLSNFIPVLGTDVPWKFQSSAVVNGVRVAFLPLTVPDPNVLPELNRRHVRVVDPFETTDALLPKLLKQSDAVVGVTHLPEETALRLAAKFPQFSAILNGHPHRVLMDHVNNVLVAQVGGYGQRVGKLTLSFDENNRCIGAKEQIRDVTAKVSKNDRRAMKELRPWVALEEQQWRKIVGHTHFELKGNGGRTTVFGECLADAVRESSKADFAFIPSSSVRRRIDKGAISEAHLHYTVSEEREIVIVRVSLNSIAPLLERLWSTDQLIPSGIKYNYDPSLRGGRRIRFSHHGRSISWTKKYAIALLRKPDVPFSLEGVSYVSTNMTTRDAFRSYVSTHTPLKRSTSDNRVQFRF